MAWPLRGLTGGGQCPTAARRGAGALPGPLARAAPPLAVALAPPSHLNHDVKGDATPRNVESTFPRKRRRRQRGLPLFLRHYAMVRASQRGLDQSEGRMKELTFIKLSVLSFPFGLTGPRILQRKLNQHFRETLEVSHRAEVASGPILGCSLLTWIALIQASPCLFLSGSRVVLRNSSRAQRDAPVRINCH